MLGDIEPHFGNQLCIKATRRIRERVEAELVAKENTISNIAFSSSAFRRNQEVFDVVGGSIIKDFLKNHILCHQHFIALIGLNVVNSLECIINSVFDIINDFRSTENNRVIWQVL